ncbi:unnamed protein product [Amoebophrya sp. A120]|nr:unnamed protein product [Amoebophrya sp. A120]|eukprot:GSA120T00017418001.1
MEAIELLDSMGNFGDADKMMTLALREKEERQQQIEVHGKVSRFEPVEKKKHKWGPPEDKPYKPLPYVDIPCGLTSKEVDQFLREQRLEEITEKIRRGILEDVDRDIRAPSPPPVYDRQGNRINTRDVRIKKNMKNEQNRLVRYMQKVVSGYVPPHDFRPQKLAKKLFCPTDKYPDAPFMSVIIGVRGENHKRMCDLSGAKIMLRGKGTDERFQTEEDFQMPLHVHIEADHEEQIVIAEKLTLPLLDPETEEYAAAQERGLVDLSRYNGFTVAINEKRCGICGAIGHMGFECPENEGGQGWKMATVVCEICGDRGHPTSDCPKARAGHVEANVHWKENANKQQQADKLYKDMMGAFGPEGDIFCQPIRPEDIEQAPGQEVPGVNPGVLYQSSTRVAANLAKGQREEKNPLNPDQAFYMNNWAQGAQPKPKRIEIGEDGEVRTAATPIVSDFGADHSMSIHPSLVALFVGTAGRTIERLKAESQCEIHLENKLNADGTKGIRIVGLKADRDRALALVRKEIDKAAAKKRMEGQGGPSLGGFGGGLLQHPFAKAVAGAPYGATSAVPGRPPGAMAKATAKAPPAYAFGSSHRAQF